MVNSWPLKKLKDLGVAVIDCVHKTPKAQSKGIPYVGIPQMKNGSIDFDANPRLISEKDYLEWTIKANPSHGDIILSRRCNPGDTAYVPKNAKFALGQNLVLLRPNPKTIHPGYLRWAVNSPIWWAEVNKYRNPGAVFDSLKCADIPNFEIPAPPYSAQITIDELLLALSDKIELNRQINQTLEQMAQTLFKSWFVDFDPVIDNALDAGNRIPEELQHRALIRQEQRKAVRQGQAPGKQQPLPDEVRQLFPDAFEESELGWVPKEWVVKTCEEISTRIGMGPFGSNIKVSTFVDSGIPVISGTHLKSVLLNDHSYNFITEEHAQKLKNSAVYRGDIVFTHAGNIGQVALIPDESEYESYMISQRQFYLRPDSSQVKSSYIVHYFHSHLGQHKLLSNASQTGVPSIARPSSHLKGIALVIPSNEVQESFDGLITRWNEKTMRTRNNIDLLTKLRDTLLPKLISGELRLDEIEAAVEQETVNA